MGVLREVAKKISNLVDRLFRPLELEVTEGSEWSQDSKEPVASDDVALLLLRVLAQDSLDLGHVVRVVLRRHLGRDPATRKDPRTLAKSCLGGLLRLKLQGFKLRIGGVFAEVAYFWSAQSTQLLH